MTSTTLSAPVLPTLDARIMTGLDYRAFGDRGLWDGTAFTMPTFQMTDAERDQTPDQWHARGYTDTARALSIWNEAHNEHATRADQANHTTDPSDRTAQHRALMAMRQRVTELERVRDELTELANHHAREAERLRNDQVSADDPRLSDFWERAHQAADDAGYCQVFDQLVEEIGGPVRVVDYSVAVEVTHTTYVTVTAPRNADERDLRDLIDDEEVTDTLRDRLAYESVTTWSVEDVEEI